MWKLEPDARLPKQFITCLSVCGNQEAANAMLSPSAELGKFV